MTEPDGSARLPAAELVVERFGLAGAAAVLLAGSQVDGSRPATGAPGNDVDYLALYACEAELPRQPADAGAAGMVSSVGVHWLLRLGDLLVNVEMVAVTTVRRLADLLGPGSGAAGRAVLQPYELRLLDRLRHGVAVVGAEYASGLVSVLALDRLPAVAFTTGLSAAESNLRSAERCLGAGDATGFALALSAAGFGLAAASAARCGAVIPLMKKSVPVLAELSRAGSEPPVSVADLAAVVVTANPDGTYRVPLPPGTYQVSASRFGYQEQSVEVTLIGAETLTEDFPLVRLPHVTVSGVVEDGAERGWPLYAKVSLPGVPQATTFSDPFTGAYQLTLPANMTHDLVVEAQYPGYHPRTETVTLGGSDQDRDVALVVDRAACTAPGYELVPRLTESFDEPVRPPGWTVVDNLGSGQVWRFDNPGGRDNVTGGDGGFAIIDSEFYGPGGTQDTMLVTAPVDLSGITEPVLRFRQDFNWVDLVPNEFGRVDVSVDGGTTWENLLHQDTGPGRGPEQLSQVVASAAGEADVRIRFHYGNAENERWWQVDDVVLGECRAAGGGLVVGHVLDQNTGAGVPTARILTAHYEEPVLPVGTPDDPQRGNGLFWFAAPEGTHPVTATASRYVSQTGQVTVTAGEVA